MNRKELVTAVAAHTGLDARDVDKALRGTTEVIEAVAAKGEQVTIMGFAKFARVDRPARMARNPATGAAVKVKASKKAKITALKGFKDAVMSPSAAPKLAKGVWPPVAAKVGCAFRRLRTSVPVEGGHPFRLIPDTGGDGADDVQWAWGSVVTSSWQTVGALASRMGPEALVARTFV